MKLKKIASLALAGIMAVSMLAGCSTSGNNGNDDPVVTPPADNSFAASINAELSDSQKAIVTFEADSKLASALNSVADKFDSNVLATADSSWQSGQVVEDFRDMMGAEANVGFGDEFKNANTKDTTAASIMIIPGELTEKGMIKEAADQIDDFINSTTLPNESGDHKYRYAYTGSVAYVKVESLNGNVSAYVVGVVVNQSVTETANT